MLGTVGSTEMSKHSRAYEEEDDSYQEEYMGKKKCRACLDFQSWIGGKEDNEEHSKSADDIPLDCPLDNRQLGRNTWSFLHTMAAYYPKKPSEQQQQDMSDFMKLFAKFYPCKPCAKDLRKDLNKYKPDVRDRYTFSQWMCEQHNRVNKKLNKSEFDCSKVMERWRDGWKDGSCD